MAIDLAIRINAKNQPRWRRDVLAGLSAACVVLPFSIAAGVLVYSPLGSRFLGHGAAIGLATAIIAGAVAAMVASSSFSVTCPNISTSIVVAALVVYLVGNAAFAHDPNLVIIAITLCVLVAGLLQIIFGLFGIARIIKFTPHSVLAGFVNSVGLIVAVSQLRPFFKFDRSAFGLIRLEHPIELLFMIAVTGGIIAIGKWQNKAPAPFIGLVVGTLAFYVLHFIAPQASLGETIGALPMTFLSAVPLINSVGVSVGGALWSVAPQIFLASLTLAAVATLQSLLSFRMMQNLADIAPQPRRGLIAQGIANCASSLIGGIFSVPAPSPINACFQAGGRTRVAGLSAAAAIFFSAIVFSSLLERIPTVVLSAILLSVAIKIVDHWTLRTLGDALIPRGGVDRKYAWQNLAVVVLVMIVSISSSIIAGATAGFGLACLIFIINMSKPIVRRRLFGDEIFSKRIRSTQEMTVLQQLGRRRTVLQLQGVLFFGNADNLSIEVNELLKDTDVVLLDLHGISDIDVSGAAILVNLIARARGLGKAIVLCNVPKSRPVLSSLEGGSTVLSDLDSGLEWMEEQALRAAIVRSHDKAIPLGELDLMEEFKPLEIMEFESMLPARDFKTGDIICSENDDADRMWILTKGTVSVWLKLADGRRRIASLAAGTTVGEMALLQSGRRSATVSADEDVSCYELNRATFEKILDTNPTIGLKLLKYFTREMARRLRLSHQDLRASE